MISLLLNCRSNAQRQDGLPQLARIAPLPAQQVVARHLHGDGAGSFNDAPGLHVVECGPHHAACIHAAVRIKAPILGCDHGLDQQLREVFQPHRRAALGAVLGDQRALTAVDA